MSRTIELPESVYENLDKVASERGMTAGDWIASILPDDPSLTEKRRLREVLLSLVGSADSAAEARTGYPPTPISDLVCEKLKRQGLRRWPPLTHPW